MSGVEHDPVNHPAHYTEHPSGIECIEVVEHLGFCIGNAIKYLWRAGLKDGRLEDLRKAAWYVQREIDRETVARRQADREVPSSVAYCGVPNDGPGVCTRPVGHPGDHWVQTEENAIPFARWRR